MMPSSTFPMLPPKQTRPAPAKKRARRAAGDLSARLKAAGKPKKPAYGPYDHGDAGAC